MTATDDQSTPLSEVAHDQRLDLGLVDEIVGAVRRTLKAGTEPSEAREEQVAEQIARETLAQWNHSQVSDGGNAMSERMKERVIGRVLDDIFRFSGFTPLLADRLIENIYVNGHDEVWISRSGKDGFEPADAVCSDDEALTDLITEWARKYGQTARQFNTRNPRLDLRLPGGQRLHAIMQVTDRPTVTIRCPAQHLIKLTDQVQNKVLSPEMRSLLEAAVNARCNIIVAGGTSSGKTTLLRSLLVEIGASERIVVLEDTAELNLRRHMGDRNIVEMETRQANSDGVGEIGLMELTRECLRMSPDRVVVGEVRGAEATYMLKAMSQGNDGSMCTLHAESVPGVLDRLRIYCSEAEGALPLPVIDGLYSNAVDLVVHLKMTSGRTRFVSAIAEVCSDRYNFLFGPDSTQLAGIHQSGDGPSPALASRLARHGYRWGAVG